MYATASFPDMSNPATRFARAVDGIEVADPLHTDTPRHIYTARLRDVAEPVRVVTVAADATATEREAIVHGLETWQALASHPAISTVHASGEHPRPWLAVTASGTSLDEGAPLSVDQAESVVADVAEAVRHAATGSNDPETRGPDPVPVAPADVRVLAGEETTAACIDWPLDPSLRSSETDDPLPSPPETGAEADTPDRRAVFRLGTLAYYAVTGQAPVAAENAESAIHEQRWPSPSFVNSVPSSFDAVVDRALHPDPTERYDSPYEFKRALLFDSEPAVDSTGAEPRASASSVDSGETPAPAEGHPGAGDRPLDSTAGEGERNDGTMGRRMLLGALGLGTVGALVGGSWFATNALLDSDTDSFPLFRYDAANTGYVPDGEGPTDGIAEAWSLDLGESIRASPVVADGIVFISNADGSIRALDVADGTERWTYSVDRSPLVAAALGDDVAYLLEGRAEEGDVTARSLTDGDERWREQVTQIGPPVRAPALFEDTLYLIGAGGLTAVDTDDRSRLWTKTGVSVSSLTAAVSADALYFGGAVGEESENGTRGLVALDSNDGTVRWTFEIEEFVSSSPALGDGTVYVGGENETVYAIDTEDGTERWSARTDGRVAASAALTDHDGGTVYTADSEGVVYALDSDDGTERWRFETDDVVLSSPAVVSDTVYVAAQDRNVYALAVEDGTERWQFATDGSMISSPAVVANTLFVGTENGTFYALTEP